ncbi:TPA: hypothetical protein ACQVH3_005117, partial [Serratia marcescens]
SISITALGQYQARSLIVNEPQSNSRHEADYVFTAFGTATPGASITFNLKGCQTGRANDCSIPPVIADAQGDWKTLPHTLTIPATYTLIINQTIDGHPGPDNPQTRSFTVYNPDAVTHIDKPENLSWLSVGNIVTVIGTATPTVATSNVLCYMDGSLQASVRPQIEDYLWGCRYLSPSVGKHTFSGRVTPPHEGDSYAEFTYMIAAPLTVTAPAEDAKLFPPVTLTGTQQVGSMVNWTSDHCGSGTALSTDSTWSVAVPGSPHGQCSFHFTQTWQEMTSPPVNLRLTLEQVPVLTSPSDVAQDTAYPISGKGEPGATITVSLEDGWHPIDTVIVGPDGNWSSRPGPLSGSGGYDLTLKETVPGLEPVTTEVPLMVENDSVVVHGTGTGEKK